MPTEVLKNNIQTTLLAAIDSNDAVITPTDPTGFPATGERARAAIGDEILIVAGGDGPQFDVARGAEGTTAVGHAAGDAVRLVLTAGGAAALIEQAHPVRVVTTVVTPSQMHALADTPVDLTPAPAADEIAVPIAYTLQFTPGTYPYFGGAELIDSTGGSFIADARWVQGATQAMRQRALMNAAVLTLPPGEPLRLTSIANIDGGSITSASTTTPGTGYEVGQVLTAHQGVSAVVALEIASVDGSGGVTGLSVLQSNAVAAGPLYGLRVSQPINLTGVSGGSGYALDDQIFVPADGEDIVSVSLAENTITVSGGPRGAALWQVGSPVLIQASPDNDGLYTVAAIAWVDSELVLTLVEPLSGDEAAGLVYGGAVLIVTGVDGGGALTDATVDVSGGGFVVDGSIAVLTALTGAGTGGSASVSSLSGGWFGLAGDVHLGDGAVTITTVYHTIPAA